MKPARPQPHLSPFLVISLILVGTVVWGFWQSYLLPLTTVGADRSWLSTAGLVAVYLITDMLFFGAFIVAALVYRTKPAFHKRLIVCATVALTTAAVGRPAPAGSLIFYLVWLAPMSILIGADLVTLKRPHAVSIAGLTLLTAAFFKNGLIAQVPASQIVGLFIVSPWI